MYRSGRGGGGVGFESAARPLPPPPSFPLEAVFSAATNFALPSSDVRVRPFERGGQLRQFQPTGKEDREREGNSVVAKNLHLSVSRPNLAHPSETAFADFLVSW